MTLRLFPRSLRQLVLLAFVLVLLPLLILAYQAYQSLKTLSAQAAEMNRTTLTDVRRGESMIGLVVEMERSYRQYCVLGDATLQQLYQTQRERYFKMLSAHAVVSLDNKLYQKLDRSFNALIVMNCQNSEPQTSVVALLESFAKANSDLVQATREKLFSRGEILQSDIARSGQFFGWQALSLFLVSLLLVLLFTRMIIGPVQVIEKMINRLGQGKTVDTTLTFQGPKELRSLAQRIVWLSERLVWLESQRHEFLRHISHELKTPLASMREGTELLADEVVGRLTDEQKEVVTILESSSRELQQLIEQLLDYNRGLSNVPSVKEKIVLREMIEKVIVAHSLPARIKEMKTECRLDAEVCWAEPQLLVRVLDNLYSNAVHYGSERGNIWISSRKVDSHLFIEVSNTGLPIPLAEQTMIFEPFYQGSQQRKGAVKGSGLGLSIARDSIRRMQGELSLVTVDYANVCFRIELPLLIEN